MRLRIKYLLKGRFVVWLPSILIMSLATYIANVNAGDAFSPTSITSTSSTSQYATTENAFKNTYQYLTGQCTWYAYGRVMELVAKGELDSSVGTKFRNAFWGRSGRDAKNWDSSNFLGGTWHCTASETLPTQYRRKGLIAVWHNSPAGHVGFVEEVNADKTQYRLTDFNRGNDTAYKNKWYPFQGTEDALGGKYPCFQPLQLDNSSSDPSTGRPLTENFVDKPTPMEWYRGCTTTAVSMLLDWFGDHGYNKLYGEPDYAYKSGCDQAYIRQDIADLYANNAASTPLTCREGEYGASPDEIVAGMTYVLEDKGYCVNEDKDECWQIVNHFNLTVQDLVNPIHHGFPLSLGVDSNTFKSHFDFENDFKRTINHRVVAYGYRTYDNDRIEISLLTGWDTDWENATRTIIINGDGNTEIKERGLYVKPPYHPDARIITRASAVKRIFERFNIPQDFGLDSWFDSAQPSDVSRSTSYYKYIATAYNKDIVHGFAAGEMQGKYGPFYSVSRVEFIKMVMNTLNVYFGVPLEASSFAEPVNVFGERFPDMDYSAWYYKFVKAAYNYGIIQGTQDGNLMPHVKLSENEGGWILERAEKRLSSASPPPVSGDYVWQGNGSLISYHGRLLPNNAGEDWPYGITQDVVQLHASTQKPVGFFQWQVNENGCNRLKLEADLPTGQNQVDITIGPWNNRDDDITFSQVKLPFVLGASNTDYQFDMENGKWYVVKIALRHVLNNDVKLNAECTTARPTDLSYRRGGGDALVMDGGYKWNGNASIISHMFRNLWYKSENNRDVDWPYGAFQDTLKVRRSSEKPMVFFQWQRDAVCSRLTFDAQLGANEKRVDIHVKDWGASNDAATVHSGVTLPHTIYDHSKDGNWRVIQIKFLKPVSYTANVTAKCSGID